jgi:hypothetical protein
MERPRSFVSSVVNTDTMPIQMPQTSELTPPMAKLRTLLNTPVGASAVAFVLIYVALGVSPSSWPLERYYSVIDSNGKPDPKRRAVISAATGAVAFYMKHYFG